MALDLDHVAERERGTVLDFMQRCQTFRWEGMAALFAPEAVLRGPLAGAGLKGADLIEMHFRQTWRRMDPAKPLVTREVEATEAGVVIRWGTDHPDLADHEGASGRTFLQFDERGRILRITLDWNPRAYVAPSQG